MAGKMKIKLLTLSYLIFVFALLLSGALGDGIASDIVYYLSFILPVVICELALKKSGESTPKRMRVSGDGLLVSLWTVNKIADMPRVFALCPNNITTKKPGYLKSLAFNQK